MKSDSEHNKDDPAATSTASGAAGKDISGHDPVVQEIEDRTKYAVDGTTRWMHFSIEKKNLRYKVEAICESNDLVMHSYDVVSHRLLSNTISHGIFDS